MSAKHRASRDSRTDYQRRRILVAIANTPLTSQQLSDKLYLTKGGIGYHLRAMMSASPRLVHIAGFTPATHNSKGAPLYLAGDKMHAEYVKVRTPKGRITVEDRREQILKHLQESMRSATEIVDEMHLQRARIYVSQLYEEGKIHIGAWRPSVAGGSPIPVYALGSGPDATRPTPQTEHEKCAKYWAKLKSDPHRHGIYKLCARLRKKPQGVFAALGI